MKRLKRCPFCGGQAKIMRGLCGGITHHVVCSTPKCYCNPMRESPATEAEAILLWQGRSPDFSGPRKKGGKG